MIASLENRARSMAEHYGAHAEDDPRLGASVRALEEAASKLAGLRAEVPEQADVERWSVLVAEATLGREAAEAVDVVGLVDEADPSLDISSTLDWWIDHDGDGFGAGLPVPARRC